MIVILESSIVKDPFSGACFAVKQDTSNPVQSVSMSALAVKEIWQRIVYDQWIVGIDVQNTGERYMPHLSCMSFSFPMDKNLISPNNNKAHMSGDEGKENHQVMHYKNFDVIYHI